MYVYWTVLYEKENKYRSCTYSQNFKESLTIISTVLVYQLIERSKLRALNGKAPFFNSQNLRFSMVTVKR